MLGNFKGIIAFLLLLVCYTLTKSQQLKQGSQWHFSDHLIVDFRQDPPLINQSSSIFTYFQQPSTICDENGDVLFYSDGITIWDRSNQIMLNGDEITSGSITSKISTVIVPHPGDGQLYYVFTVLARNIPIAQGLHYSVVDMSGNGGFGRVIQKDVIIGSSLGTGLAVVSNFQNTGFWVIVHGIPNNNYYAFQVVETGISSPVTTSIGQMWNPLVGGFGQFQASSDGTKLAAVSPEGLEFYEFNSKTGKLSNRRVIPDETYGFRGIEFSPNSELLYKTTDDRQIFQYDVSSGVVSDILASVVKLDISNEFIIEQLRLAYNGKIYGSFGGGQGTSHLVSIEDPNVKGLGCNAVRQGLNIGAVPVGLPITVQSFYRESPYIPDVKSCVYDSTRVTIYSIGYADSVFWDFGDGKDTLYYGLSGKSVLHVYDQPGIYHVKAMKFIGDIYRELVSTVEIGTPPIVDLGKDTVLCSGEMILLGVLLEDGQQYEWSTGSDNRTVSVNHQGTYKVEVNNSYCTRSDSIAIDYLDYPLLSLGYEIRTCQEDPVPLTAPYADDYTYLWSNGNATPTIMVTESGWYKVSVSHGRCTSMDSAKVVFRNIYGVEVPSDTILVQDRSELIMNLDGVNIEQWIWDFGDSGFLVNNEPNIWYEYSRSGTYMVIVSVTNSDDCFEQYRFYVKVLDYLFYPNMITPNGDEKNDMLEIKYNGDNPITLAIYDRWGKEIYFSKKYQNNWTGSDLPSGVYYYKLLVDKKYYLSTLTIMR